MVPNDIEIRAMFRAPVLFRKPDGTCMQASYLLRGAEVAIRGVDPDALRPFPADAPAVLAGYRVHDGRGWLPVTRADRMHKSWRDLGEAAPATVGEVVSTLCGDAKGARLAVFGRGPFSARFGDGWFGWPARDVREDLEADDSLVSRAVDHVVHRFADGVVHDGATVYVATPPPVVLAAERYRRGLAPRIVPLPEVEPLLGPSGRLDRARDYLDLAARHSPVSRAAGTREAADLADAVAYHVERAGLAIRDADLFEFVDDLHCLAWGWAATALARRSARSVREAIQPMADGMPRTAILGSVALLDQAERVAALDAGIALLARIAEVAPNLLGWRHADWVAEYAATIARPRLLEGLPVPPSDMDALDALVR